MAEKIGSIFWQVSVDNDKANKQLRDTSDHANMAGKSLEKTSKASNLFKLGMIGAGAAAIKFGHDSVKAFFDAEQAHTKLATNLKVLKSNTDANVTSLEKLAAKMQKVGVIEDDTIIAGMSQLATFKLQSSTIERLTPKIGDMIAQLKGHNATAEDTVAINNLMGKAMTGSTAALGRYGIVMDAHQKMVMKTGTETERAAMLVDILSQNYGKVNEALGKTPQGKITQLKNSFNDLQEAVGGALVGAALPAMTALGSQSGSVMELLKGVIGTVGKVAGDTVKAISPILGILKPIIPILKGMSAAVGVIPPIFLQFAVGSALLSKGLGRIGSDSKSATDDLKKMGITSGELISTHNSLGKSLFTTSSNVKDIGFNVRRLSGIADGVGSKFTTVMKGIGESAKSAGSNILDALGGPIGIGLMAGMAAFSAIKGNMDEARAKAKELKVAADAVAKALRFDTSAGKSGLTYTLQMFDQLIEKSAEFKKATEYLQKNLQISGGPKGESKEALNKDLTDFATYSSKMKALRSQAGQEFGQDIGTKFTRTFGNAAGGKDAAKDAEKQYTNLKKVHKEMVTTQRQILTDNASLAKALGRDDLTKIFNENLKGIDKADLGKVYENTAAATAKLNAEQAKVVDSTTRAALGLGTLTEKQKGNSQALVQGAAAAGEIQTKLSAIALQATKISADTALKNADPKLLAGASQQYLALAKTNADQANEYAIKFANSLGVSPEEADKVAQSLVDLGTKTDEGYKALTDGWESKLIPIDQIFADKFTIKIGGPSVKQLQANLATLRGANDTFQIQIGELIKAGKPELAKIIAEQGVEAGGATAKSAVDAVHRGDNATLDSIETDLKATTDQTKKLSKDNTQALKDYYAAHPDIINPGITVDPVVDVKPVDTSGWFTKLFGDFGSKPITMASDWEVTFAKGAFHARAAGGPVKAGQPYLVGEQGPELYMPQGNGTIIPAGQTSRMLGQASSQLSASMGSTVNFNVDASGIMATSRAHTREVASALIEAANEELIHRGYASEVIGGNKLRAAQ